MFGNFLKSVCRRSPIVGATGLAAGRFISNGQSTATAVRG